MLTLIIITYIKQLTDINHYKEAHSVYLQQYYNKGLISENSPFFNLHDSLPYRV